MSRTLIIGLVGLVSLSTALVASEPIRLALVDFKFKADSEKAADLVKYDDDKLCFYSIGTATTKLMIPADAEYTIVVEASGTEALKEKAKFTLKVGDKVVKEAFELTTEDRKEYKFAIKLTKGETTLSIRFTNDLYKENEYDRNLFVHEVRLERK